MLGASPGVCMDALRKPMATGGSETSAGEGVVSMASGGACRFGRWLDLADVLFWDICGWVRVGRLGEVMSRGGGMFVLMGVYTVDWGLCGGHDWGPGWGEFWGG